MSEDRAHQAFLEILEEFKKNNLPIVELRPKEKDITNSYRGDHDYFLNPKFLRCVLGCINAICIRNQVSYIFKQSKTSKYRFELIGEQGRIILELWPVLELTVSQDRHLGYRIITWSAIEEELSVSTGNSNIKDITYSLIYITHLYYKKKNLAADEVQNRLSIFQNRIKDSSNELQHVARDTIKLLESLQNGKTCIRNANAHAIQLINELSVKNASFLKSQYEKWRHRFHYWSTVKLCNLIPIVGPDGSGKSTLIFETTSEYGSKSKKNSIRFKSIFMLSPSYKWNLRRLKRAHRNLKKNKIDEYMINTILITSLFVFTAFFILRRLIFARKTLIDRYFYDYLLVPLRNKGKPKRIPFYRLYTFLIPATRHLVVLNCTTDQILMRKKELSEESISALMNLYLDQIVKKRIPKTLFCHTGEDLSRNKAHLAKFIYNK